MSVHDVRPALSSPPVPRPRPAEQDDAVEHVPADEAMETGTSARRPAQLPWPEPWRSSDGARPRTDYWDVTTASWQSRGACRY